MLAAGPPVLAEAAAFLAEAALAVQAGRRVVLREYLQARLVQPDPAPMRGPRSSTFSQLPSVRNDPEHRVELGGLLAADLVPLPGPPAHQRTGLGGLAIAEQPGAEHRPDVPAGHSAGR